ncbi:acyltransferase family protein [Pseudobacillus badius]|uniref:acyltransferase family protein n=1 Tax=Bacillus badius TaxID=1455 RepID=UPI0007B071D5|nr:acyltransferase family protein [Bacillus badius]KZO01086.1 peptidoglycan O-acetyltransferase [Bacillus badius]OCS89137.1 peptidoglycan O-acetyltransferase [Bacillus badius]OVE50901.1 acetyltransferase [Bacillus badius]TDW01618.1 peptidoglycan-N-acetylmuramate O-acetyltransferase [Bacillus badius]
MLGKTQKHRYVPGLDGLRALAVLAVIAYHLNFSWAKGGFLGVDIFFVLSGYLITSTILPAKGEEWTFDLREFWMGRIRRLLPAAYFMIILTFIWVMLFHQELLDTVRGDAVASIFYASNWWFIFHEVSYFDSFGSPSPLKNLWSLAIEEQFYIVWPLVLAAGLYIFKGRQRFSLFVFLGALCSAVLMGVLYQPGADPSRVYYGTDTRSFELLIGAWLALVWPMNRLSSNRLSPELVKTLNMTSLIAFGIFLLCAVFIDEYQTFLYRGGMLLIGLNAAVLVACICHPASLLGKWLSWKPLRWIGSRSYGIYLWHYPVIVLGTPVHEIGNPVYWRIGLQLILILIIAEFSYRLIEMPIRKHGFRPFFQKHLAISALKWRNSPPIGKVSTILIPLAVLIFAAGIAGAVADDEQQETKQSHPTEVKIDGGKQESLPAQGDASHSKEEQTPEDEEIEAPQEEGDAPADASYTEILAIGDSVTIDIASSLQERYSDMTIDAKIGRQVSQAAKLASGYASFNRPDKAVIIQLGTNGYFTDHQIDTLLSSFSKAHIYLVNTRVPRPWEGKVNRTLAKKAQEYENVTLVDWYSAAVDHPEYFAADGVHLLPKGIAALTALIDQSIAGDTHAAG